MFGYVVVNKPELRIREFERYRSYYCGLCKTLQRKFGLQGQLSLSYDMTFLLILLSCLYETENQESAYRCIMHPLKKQKIIKNEIMDYAADMTLLLTWYKCKDDILDERKLSKVIYGKSIKNKVDSIMQRYSRQGKAVYNNLQKLSICEKKELQDIDELSGCFGHLLEEIFVIKEDEWEENLRRIGFYLGKFIYILDAYDDIEKDKKKGCFNPFIQKETERTFDDWIKQLLMLAAVEFAKEFEKLPIIEKDVEILRNIIYSGVWTRYEEVKHRRNEKK